MGWTMSDGEAQLVSARRLSNWPLIVSVSLPKNEIYAGAWLAGLVALTALVARQARREAMLMGELEHRLKNVLTANASHAVAMVVHELTTNAKSKPVEGCQPWRFDRRGARTIYATRGNTLIEGPAIHLVPVVDAVINLGRQRSPHSNLGQSRPKREVSNAISASARLCRS